MFIQGRIFGNVMKIRKTIETCLQEYLADKQTEITKNGSVPEDFKEDITRLLQSYFISDYYITTSLENAQDIDFEIIQNNYSERKLVGMNVKTILPNNLHNIAKSFFDRFHSRFMYLFLINFDPTQNVFNVLYKTKDGELRNIIVK